LHFYNRHLRPINADVGFLNRSSSIVLSDRTILGIASVHTESISLPNSLVIRNISAIHDSIAAQLRDSNAICLEIPSEADVDLSFVQLMEAARLHAKSSGKSIRLSSPAQGALLNVLQRAGFVDSFTEEDRQFWFHNEVYQ
jgi:hypothetical protein